MIIHVRVQGDSRGLRVDVPESRFRITLPNTMWLDSKGLIHGFGEAVEEPAGLVAVAIYSPTDFHADRTFAAIQYFSFRAWPERSGLRRILQLFDRFEWDLQLDGYEAIPEPRRRQFEGQFAELALARAFSINGRYRRLPPNLLRIRR